MFSFGDNTPSISRAIHDLPRYMQHSTILPDPAHREMTVEPTATMMKSTRATSIGKCQDHKCICSEGLFTWIDHLTKTDTSQQVAPVGGIKQLGNIQTIFFAPMSGTKNIVWMFAVWTWWRRENITDGKHPNIIFWSNDWIKKYCLDVSKHPNNIFRSNDWMKKYCLDVLKHPNNIFRSNDWMKKYCLDVLKHPNILFRYDDCIIN
mgnify:CR=1 FL=1